MHDAVAIKIGRSAADFCLPPSVLSSQSSVPVVLDTMNRGMVDEDREFALAMRRRGDRLALSLSGIGERFGHGWLIYNPGVMRIFHRYARADSAAIAAFTSEFPDAQQWVDVGAGTGAYAAEARRAGRDAVGYELSVFGRLLGRLQGARMGRFDLTKPEPVPGYPSRADLAYCFEVAEHL